MSGSTGAGAGKVNTEAFDPAAVNLDDIDSDDEEMPELAPVDKEEIKKQVDEQIVA